MRPFHHYCKIVGPEPQIVCLIFDNTEPNAPLTQVQYIMGKKLTRLQLKLADWNWLWHDHARWRSRAGPCRCWVYRRIRARRYRTWWRGRIGIIYTFGLDDKLPNGKIKMAQASVISRYVRRNTIRAARRRWARGGEIEQERPLRKLGFVSPVSHGGFVTHFA